MHPCNLLFRFLFKDCEIFKHSVRNSNYETSLYLKKCPTLKYHEISRIKKTTFYYLPPPNILFILAPAPPRDPCNPNPCGANADAVVRQTSCQCTCRPEYFGDPYAGCRPECVINQDCSKDKACSR